jgi:hypothetical protein
LGGSLAPTPAAAASASPTSSLTTSRQSRVGYLEGVVVVAVLLAVVVGEGAVPDEDPRSPASLVDQEDLGKDDDTEDGEEHHDDEEAHVGPLAAAEVDVLLLAPAGRPHLVFSGKRHIVTVFGGGVAGRSARDKGG